MNIETLLQVIINGAQTWVIADASAKRRSEYLYVAIGSSKRLALWFGSSFLIMGPVKVKIFLMLHLPLL